jgi:hypothetical protein
LDDFSQAFGPSNGPFQCLAFVNLNDFDFKNTPTRLNTHLTPKTKKIVTIGNIGVKIKNIINVPTYN